VSTARSWPTITCTACGTTSPGHPKVRRCRRCYARAQHTVRVCAGCNQLRRHLAAGLCARCYRLSRTRQQRCMACQEVRPIHFGSRCERCKQRARARSGRCARCGQQATLHGRYCRACLERAAERVGSCAECLCWTGLLGGRCKPCRLFGWQHDLGTCPSCGRQVPLGAAGRCRLCLATSRATGTIPSRAAGIQLFALVGVPARVRPSELEPPPRPAAAGLGQLRLPRAAVGGGARPHAGLAQRPGLGLARRVQSREHQQLLAALAGYGQARGWSPETLRRIRRSLVVLLASQPTLSSTSPPDATAVRQFLIDRHLTALRVTEFLADQGLVTSDQHATFDRWLARRLERLPAQIRVEVHTWVEVLRGRGPRPGRPRKAATIQGYLRALEPALAAWSARYPSLRQVTSDDVTAQLAPLAGPTHRLVLTVMRSLFGALKAGRVVFINPTAGLELRREPPPVALGLDPARRAGLLKGLPRPDQRLLVLLAGVHALRPHQIRVLTLDDVDLAAGTLGVQGRSRRLDGLTLEALRAWLELRRARWPASANPYLLVNQSTAGGLAPVTRSYVQQVFQQLGLTAQDLRIDRLLAEVHATAGDPLTLTRLFGIADTTAIRYCLEFGPLDQVHQPRQQREFAELTATDPPETLQ
jgi:integrase